MQLLQSIYRDDSFASQRRNSPAMLSSLSRLIDKSVAEYEVLGKFGSTISGTDFQTILNW